jgi:hypothetical protein
MEYKNEENKILHKMSNSMLSFLLKENLISQEEFDDMIKDFNNLYM